nr:hypothetical protein [Tanacetum cinerariifolium]
ICLLAWMGRNMDIEGRGLDTKAKDDESDAEGTESESESEDEGLGSESEESKDEGPGSGSEEAASDDQHQQAVPVEDTIKNEPLGLGYRNSSYAPTSKNSSSSTAMVVTGVVTGEATGDGTVGDACEIGKEPDRHSASPTVPSLVASPETTPVTTIAVDEDEFLEAWESGMRTRAGYYDIWCPMVTSFSPRGMGKIDRRP